MGFWQVKTINLGVGWHYPLHQLLLWWKLITNIINYNMKWASCAMNLLAMMNCWEDESLLGYNESCKLTFLFSAAYLCNTLLLIIFFIDIFSFPLTTSSRKDGYQDIFLKVAKGVIITQTHYLKFKLHEQYLKKNCSHSFPHVTIPPSSFFTPLSISVSIYSVFL